MSLPFTLAKIILSLLGNRRRQEFIRACQNPARTQEDLKNKILKNSLKAFPDRPTTYLDYEGSPSLTKEAVAFKETTSGSTGSKKQIPYTKSLLKSFEHMFLLWAHDLIFHSDLGIKKGKFFMSVSPQIGEKPEDDRKYLSPILSFLLTPFLVSNPDKHKARTSEEFLMNISRELLHARDLEIISIWSPTYLLSLMDFIDKNKQQLGLKNEVIHWDRVWPELKLISCWTEAQAEKSASRLKEKLPGVFIQGKGLLSTEAPVTIPWSLARGNVPLLTETYLEFLDKDQHILKLHELNIGETYVVLTSQFNGYLRYNTQDEVQVTGFYHHTPILSFLGRTGQYSDLAGEKLSESILKRLYSNTNASFLIVPDESHDLPRYVIYVDTSIPEPDMDWEKPLMENHHYKLARSLGQLSPVKVLTLPDLNQKIMEFYQQQGMVLGDIKEKLLITKPLEARNFIEWIELELGSSL